MVQVILKINRGFFYGGEIMDKFSERQEGFWFTLLRKDDTVELWHREMEIVFILRGTGRICFDNAGTVYRINEGDIFVINSFQMCAVDLDDDALALSLSLSAAFISSMSPETLNSRINCRSFLFSEDKQQPFHLLRRDLANAFRVQYKNEMRHSLYLKSKVAALLEDLVRYFLDDASAVCNETGWERLRLAIDYIHHHYMENITLEDLAGHTYLSTTYISHSFSKYLGVSFTGYLTQVRLVHAIRRMHGTQTLTNIAYESGFPNVNAMIKAFKQYRGLTPGAYRKLLETEAYSGKDDGQEPVDETYEEYQDVFSSLMKYAGTWKNSDIRKETMTEIQVDMAGRKSRLSWHWKRVITAGYARDLTNGSLQAEIARVQKQVGFEFIRFKGILDDDMCLMRLDIRDKIIINYTYVDEVIDFILSVDAKPMIELGHMPRIMASNPIFHSMRVSAISLPKDYSQWEMLIRNLIEHLDRRYGTHKVRQWLFTPWLPPDYMDFKICTAEEYEQIYKITYQTIKSVCKDFLVCGPGCIDYRKYMGWFLKMCKGCGCIPDILTFRSFASVMPEEEQSGLKLVDNNSSFYLAVSKDEDFLYHSVQDIRTLMEEAQLGDIPLILEEWSNNIWQRDLCNDTCFKSAYLFKNILENNGHLNGMGYFSIDDRLDEVPPTPDLFHGGFGLFTKNGIPKSAYCAMELLGQMGDRCLKKGPGYFISQKETEVQIYLYNYTHYDMLYRYRHMVNMTKTDRYKVFNPGSPMAFHIQLDHMTPGEYRICRYGINRQAGSSYDLWVRMGAPDPVNSDEEEMLKILSQPQYHVETAEATQPDGRLNIKANLEPLDVMLIKVIKK